MGPGENVDSRSLEGLLWRVSDATFSKTYSASKIAQPGIVEPIHPLLNKKMLAQPGGKIILSAEHSKRLLTTFLVSGIALANDRSIFDSVNPDNHILPER